MGQGQSQDGDKVSSGQAGAKESKDRKSRRKSSGKGKERRNNVNSAGITSSQSPSVPSSSNSFASHSGDVGNGSTKKGSSTSGSSSSQAHHSHHHNHQHNHHTAPGPREVSSYSGHHQHGAPVTDTSPGAQRGSYYSSSNGGERSAPSRQFSLTRQTSSTQSKQAQIVKYFIKYKDSAEDAILAEGMEKFCIDLDVDPTEFIVLVLAWKFEASQMCRFTKEEFINGCQKMQAHDSKSLKERFPDLLRDAKEKRNFKDLYNFTFSFGLDHSTGQRSLPIDMAMPLWDLVFTQNRPELLDPWFKFLKESGVRGISRDTWNMFLPFVDSILPDLSNYDESEAWPSLFDDFVEAAEVERTTL